MSSQKNITAKVFEALIEVARIGIISFSRNSFYMKELMDHQGYKPWEINTVIKRFQRIKYINYSRKSKIYTITKKGRNELHKYYIKSIEFNYSRKTWDNMWRIIVFDIPENKRNKRDVLRSTIKRWDFYKLQRSVFVTPYKCEKEINLLSRILEIQDNIFVITTNKIDGIENKLRNYYRL